VSLASSRGLHRSSAKSKVFLHDYESISEFPYQIGAGIYDITGPAAEVGMMGYAMLDQTTAGIHFRLRARAFIIVDRTSQQRIAFASLDTCMVTDAIKTIVLERLHQLYGNLYVKENVMISSTHNHAGPGGYNWYPLYDITTWGFHKENFEVIVNGVVKAIQMAHNRLENGKILVNTGIITNLTNINRSPSAYEANPPQEKAKWAWMGNTDKFITVLKFVTESGNEIGMLNWYAVHGTSMTNTNRLISGDNKGYASYLFEKMKNPPGTLPGNEKFVAAFAQTNEGDVSPNTRGAFCDNGRPCEYAHSTCDGTSQGCHGYGPGEDEFESTKIIGTNQCTAAWGLYHNATVPLKGPIAYRHTYVDFEHITISPEFTGLPNNVSTCVAALGDSFAAGTTDGPGDFDFVQGTNSSKTNPYWNWLAKFIADPPKEQEKCHDPKPILLYVGGIQWPCRWSPGILPLQMFRIGQLYIIGVPGEFTTMAGRRLRDTVRKVLEANGGADRNTIIVIAGLSNSYSHYVTTQEEYLSFILFQAYNVTKVRRHSTAPGPSPAISKNLQRLPLLSQRI
jgi:neutral ceramidase